ncbi:WG repeat-containing protein [Desertivirga brevis]|uniref:WG repeat-containing protein n=1 Tax=Desertivirga brevis TaxID=2810310 RepID=UPI001A963955|nr:WG repeat-containing protein [Pedobacter sp. SYSU D00873]
MKEIKLLLLATSLLFCNQLIAQVPGGSEIKGDISLDDGFGVSIEMPDPKRNPTAGYYQQNGKYGFVLPNDVQEAAIYDNIFSTTKGFIVIKDKLYGIANKRGVILGRIEFDSLGTSQGDSYVVKKNGRYGTLSSTGKTLLPIQYNKILYSDHPTLTFIEGTEGGIQIIFNETQKSFPQKIERAELYGDLVLIKSEGKFGVLKRKQIVPFEYDSIFVAPLGESGNVKPRSFSNSRKPQSLILDNSYRSISCLAVRKDGKYGLIDSAGKVIFPAENDAVNNYETYRYYSVKKGNFYGIYFTEAKVKTGIEFDRVYADGIGYVMAVKDKKAGAYNLQGKLIVPFEYDPGSIMQSSLGLRVGKNNKKGIISKTGATLIPPLYDDVDPFWEGGLNKFMKVRSGEKYGVVNLKNEVIIPVKFEWIGEEEGMLKVATTSPRKFGLYDKNGQVIVPASYRWIIDSDTEKSNLIVLEKDSVSYNFLNKKSKTVLFPQNISAFGYLHNQEGLISPSNFSHQPLLWVRNKSKKVGMLNELSGIMQVPFAYDEILQHFESRNHSYLTARKGNKYGLIDEKNRIVLPFIYDAIRVDLIESNFDDVSDATYAVTVAKGKRFGTVNLKNQVQIPFLYADLQRISGTGFYKAKTGNHYVVINSKNEVLNKGPFDDVANFEQGNRGASNLQALTFFEGKMRVIDEKGKFITSAVPMHAHQGYKTFDELKYALVNAYNSKSTDKLKEFADKVAPSEHLLYYLKVNLLEKRSLREVDPSFVKEKYYRDLLSFKDRWANKSGWGYDPVALTQIADYTLYDNGIVTNKRRSDPAFGDTKFMEKLLRNAIKVNGFWISSYFMFRGFDTFNP